MIGSIVTGPCDCLILVLLGCVVLCFVGMGRVVLCFVIRFVFFRFFIWTYCGLFVHASLTRGIGRVKILQNISNHSAFFRLSHVINLWPLLVLYGFFFVIYLSTFLCFGVKRYVNFRWTSIHYTWIGASWSKLPAAGYYRCVQDLSVILNLFLFFGRILCFLTHSPFPVSILNPIVDKFIFYYDKNRHSLYISK